MTATTPVAPETLLTSRARRMADTFAEQSQPQCYALGVLAGAASLMVAHAHLYKQTDQNAAGGLLATQRLESLMLACDEVLDVINGWHAAEDRINVRRRAENSLSTVAWPAAGGDAA